MTDSVLQNPADRTDRVTASFIQDLMRRALQNAIAQSSAGTAVPPAPNSAPITTDAGN